MGLIAGMAAGAAGTTAFNIVTYVDMLVRGREASSLPADAAGELTERAGVDLGGQEEADNRRSALGALLGFVTGVGVGAVYGMAVGDRKALVPLAGAGLAAAAMAGSDAPMTALGLTDPTDWKPGDWAADVVPHLAYGLVTAAVYRGLIRRR